MFMGILRDPQANPTKAQNIFETTMCSELAFFLNREWLYLLLCNEHKTTVCFMCTNWNDTIQESKEKMKKLRNYSDSH